MLVLLIITTIILVGINVLIGLKARTEDTFESFIASKNHFGSLAISLSYLGTILGGGMFFSIGAMGYQSGLAPLSLILSYIIGFFLMTKFISKVREVTDTNNINTMYEYFDFKFKNYSSWSRYYKYSVVFINLVIYFFMLAGQFLILSAFYNYFFKVAGSLLLIVSVVIIAISILIYAVLGGIKKDILTDIYQSSWLIFIIILLSTIILFGENSFSNFAKLPHNFLNGMGYGIIFPIGVVLFFSPAFIGRYDFWQRIISSKDKRTAVKSLWFTIPIIILAYCLFVYLGVFARANAGPDLNENNAVLWSVENLVPTSIFVLVVIGLYAAIMSTADTLLNVSTVSLWKLLNINKSNDNTSTIDLKNIKKYSLIVGLFSILIIFLAESVVTIIVGAFSSLAIFTPSIVYVSYAKKPNAKVATLSLLLPYIFFLILFIFLPSIRIYAFVPAFILSVIILLLAHIYFKLRR